MDLLNYSEILKGNWPVLCLSLIFTVLGSFCTNLLYQEAQKRDSLSFPKQIYERAKFRKPFLFLLLLICFYKAWNQLSGPELYYTMIEILFLLLFSVTDFEQHVILNEMLLSFAAIGLCYTIHLNLSISDHVLASLVGGLFFLLLAVIGKGALGGGDIKLIAALGLWLGSKPLASVIVYGAIAGGAAALLLLLAQKTTKHQYIAYGPYFALSGICIILKLLRVLF